MRTKLQLSFLGLAALCFSLGLAPLTRAEATGAPSYNRDIRPILSDRCFACHGPDAGTRKAELRLDTEAGAHEWAVIPGDVGGSELVNRISTDDSDMKMPPVDSKKPP